MKLALAFAAALWVVAGSATAQTAASGAETVAAVTAFAPGQIWTLKDDGMGDARLIIDKLETLDGQSVVHISLTGVPVPDGAPIVMAHLPFSEEAVRESVGQLIQADGQPYAGFAEGYAMWQQAHGGVFTASVPVVVGLMVAAMHAPPLGQSG